MKSLEERKKVIKELLKEKSYIPMKEKELAVILQVKKEDREELKAALDALLKEGSIEVTKRGKYKTAEDKRLTGIFHQTVHGYGFVSEKDEEYFIRSDAAGGAFDGDTVEIIPSGFSAGKRKEAMVTNIIKRGRKIVTGKFVMPWSRYGFVVPDNRRLQKDIFVPLERSMDAVDGQKVVCEILNYGSDKDSPEGRIIEILGSPDEPGVDVLSVIRDRELPYEFPVKVLNQAERLPDSIKEDEISLRRDLRGLLTITIDGEDSKDLDDAVSLEEVEEGFRLGVHIADVSDYVQENSALDREALKRGTSVYFPDRVLPMLPEKLSNGICSLNENEDRLTLSVIMLFDRKGELKDHEIVESVIRSKKRMTYTEVNSIIENKDEAERPEVSGDIISMILKMNSLAELLREKRKHRGSIDFDMPESKVILDKEGHVVDIKPYERNSATKLIEDFMLMANETVAEHYYWLGVPFVYRTHADPETDKMKELSAFTGNLGYNIHIKGGSVHPMEISKLLASCEGKKEEALINRLTLRAMQKARYSDKCTGHFGLALKYYCHFTSPIRRYPDLQIHRIIKEDIKGRLSPEKKLYYEERLGRVCISSSETERRAEEAEREVLKHKKAEYMSRNIGKTYHGIVSSVTRYGMYVELENTVEGLVHVSRMDDYYIYDENDHSLTGDIGGRRFQPGQRVCVIVSEVDMGLGNIDFELIS